jgi:glutaredoxin-related protein
VKEYSAWPTYPQLYVAGELVGGCDIVLEMDQSGELQQLLQEKLGPAPAAAAAPPAAAAAAPPAPAAAGGGLTPEVRSKLEGLVNQQPVMLFMKGTPEAPR